MNEGEVEKLKKIFDSSMVKISRFTIVAKEIAFVYSPLNFNTENLRVCQLPPTTVINHSQTQNTQIINSEDGG
jgi:hypothetical protein